YNLQYPPGSIYDPRADLRLVCETAIAAGIVVCVAAGNSGQYANEFDWRFGPPIDYRIPHNISSPGDVPSVITLGATDVNDVISPISSIGPTTWSDVPEYGDYSYPSGLMKPDISAPGVGIISTKRGGGYEQLTGTSMATPSASGSTALLLQVNPNLTPAQIKYALEMSAIDLGASGKDGVYGSGRIDVNKATKYVLEHYGGKIIQNLTIPSGETWTFYQGVTVTIQPSASIIVNGTLNANGTNASHITFDRIGSSGSWGGIVFNSGSSGSVEYCNIYHATNGITCSYTLPMIRYNTISNNTTGISVYNIGTVSNEISYNTIQSNTYQGIYLSYASPKIYSNTISGNAYYGISCRYYSSPYLYGNTITGHPSSALSCYYYSSARLVPWNAYGYYWGAGRNIIKNNTGNGISAAYMSNLYLGSSPYGGHNSICNNTGTELSAYYNCNIMAEINYWGTPLNTSEFYAYQSTIDYTPADTIDWNPDNQSIVRRPNGISNLSTTNSVKSDLDKAY
ncbi:MAG: S8 family serine peptidase, partial [Ignavibacteria bacterium]|nr:S8 family serine peptidase [Ignavibacteria bacterium]